jgi:hypothetical protein
MERRLKGWQKVLMAALPTLLGFLLFILSPVGINLGFPPSLWWANRCNRWTFERHQDRYREMAAVIKQQVVGVKGRTLVFFEIASGGELPTLKRLPENTPTDKLWSLFAEERLIEAQRFQDGLVVRFLTRRVTGGGAYSLIWWDPKPAGDCVWWATDWWDNQHIDWIDGQWWSTYCSRPRDPQDWAPGRVGGS